MAHAYPEIDVQVSAAAKFPVADLEGHRHLVVLVQLLVEAFALVRFHLNVVRRRQGEQAARRCEETKWREEHCCGGRRSGFVVLLQRGAGCTGDVQRGGSEMPGCPQHEMLARARASIFPKVLNLHLRQTSTLVFMPIVHIHQASVT